MYKGMFDVITLHTHYGSMSVVDLSGLGLFLSAPCRWISALHGFPARWGNVKHVHIPPFYALIGSWIMLFGRRCKHYLAGGIPWSSTDYLRRSAHARAPLTCAWRCDVMWFAAEMTTAARASEPSGTPRELLVGRSSCTLDAINLGREAAPAYDCPICQTPKALYKCSAAWGSIYDPMQARMHGYCTYSLLVIESLPLLHNCS